MVRAVASTAAFTPPTSGSAAAFGAASSRRTAFLDREGSGPVSSASGIASECGGCRRVAVGGGHGAESARSANRTPRSTRAGTHCTGGPTARWMAGYGPLDRDTRRITGRPPRSGARTVQATVRTALTTIVFAKTSWKPCLVGLE